MTRNFNAINGLWNPNKSIDKRSAAQECNTLIRLSNAVSRKRKFKASIEAQKN